MPIILNGTGTISGLTAGGLPDGVITTDDIAAGAVTTAKLTGGPAFSVKRGTAQSFSASTWTKVQLNSEDFDTASCFDSSTNYRFTPNVAGYYQINATIETNNVSGSYMISIYKNGNSTFYGQYNNTTTSGSTGAISTLLYLNGSTDYVELYGYSNAAGNSFYERSHLSGFLARPA